MTSDDAALRAEFENLTNENFSITSEASPDYNCISWAMGETQIFWDPILALALGYYWPRRVQRAKTIAAYVAALGTSSDAKAAISKPAMN